MPGGGKGEGGGARDDMIGDAESTSLSRRPALMEPSHGEIWEGECSRQEQTFKGPGAEHAGVIEEQGGGSGAYP